MNKLIIIGIILIIMVGGGIYLTNLDGENIKEKLGFDEPLEEEKPKGITIKEIVSENE